MIAGLFEVGTGDRELAEHEPVDRAKQRLGVGGGRGGAGGDLAGGDMPLAYALDDLPEAKVLTTMLDGRPDHDGTPAEMSR